MTDPYTSARRRVARKIKKWKTGEVTLTRKTGAPDPAMPYKPGERTVDVYRLDARANGVAAEYVNGATILATDLMLIASPRAVHTLTDGEDAGGATVDIVPLMTDVLKIDGVTRTMKKIEAVPAGGPAARFHIFVAS